MTGRRPKSLAVIALWIGAGLVHAQEPGPRLTLVFPPAGGAGTKIEVSLAGSGLDGATELLFDYPGIKAKSLGNRRFEVEIPRDAPIGLVDVRAYGPKGLSAPRNFLVTGSAGLVESNTLRTVKLGQSVSAVIEAPGNVDALNFQAKAGQHIAIDCLAERLDSKLQAVLELRDAKGRTPPFQKSHSGLDPRIDFTPREDGEYQLRVHDLTYSGGPEHVYHLEFRDRPEAEAAWPNVVSRGTRSQVTLIDRAAPRSMQVRSFEVQAPSGSATEPLGIFSRPARFQVEEFALRAASARPIPIGLTDLPVVVDGNSNHVSSVAQFVDWPVEVSGRLDQGAETDWFRFRARRGEVIWLEAFGDRIGSPVDLELSVFDSSGSREYLRLTDPADDGPSGLVLLNHSDPIGRWVAPADADYLILVRNVVGGSAVDPRRLYRLSIRREEPDFRLLAIPGGARDPGVCNIPRGGQARIDIVAHRRRGFSGPIRVQANGLPSGLECPDTWLGPGVDRVPLIISAGGNSEPGFFGLSLRGRAEVNGVEIIREAQGVTTIPTSTPLPSSRLTGRIALGITGEAGWSLTATPSRSIVSQGGVVDIAANSDAIAGAKPGDAELTAIGIPAERADRPGKITAAEGRGWYSFQVPERLPPGFYSFAIRGETQLTRVPAKTGAKPSVETVAALSNAMTIEVVPGAFDLRLDPKNPTKIKRGQIVQIRYKAFRRNGFIGKIHTELTAPDGVVGLRARGVTFVGQTDSGSIQVVASDDAPLGRQPFLRLEGVGTVEDEPIHHAACYLDLEIIE